MSVIIPFAPWACPFYTVDFHLLSSCRRSLPAEVRKTEAEAYLSTLSTPSISIFSDGTVCSPLGCGGAGVSFATSVLPLALFLGRRGRSAQALLLRRLPSAMPWSGVSLTLLLALFLLFTSSLTLLLFFTFFSICASLSFPLPPLLPFLILLVTYIHLASLFLFFGSLLTAAWLVTKVLTGQRLKVPDSLHLVFLLILTFLLVLSTVLFTVPGVKTSLILLFPLLFLLFLLLSPHFLVLFVVNFLVFGVMVILLGFLLMLIGSLKLLPPLAPSAVLLTQTFPTLSSFVLLLLMFVFVFWVPLLLFPHCGPTL